MRHALLAASFALACGGLVFACTQGTADTACTCGADEKFDGESCVAAADFVAPANCTDDGTAVCGCDGQGYTTECAAFAEGVEVRNAGPCEATGGGCGGGGW